MKTSTLLGIAAGLLVGGAGAAVQLAWRNRSSPAPPSVPRCLPQELNLRVCLTCDCRESVQLTDAGWMLILDNRAPGQPLPAPLRYLP